jgi:hypothetical protein
MHGRRLVRRRCQRCVAPCGGPARDGGNSRRRSSFRPPHGRRANPSRADAARRGWCAVQVVEGRSPCSRARRRRARAPDRGRDRERDQPAEKPDALSRFTCPPAAVAARSRRHPSHRGRRLGLPDRLEQPQVGQPHQGPVQAPGLEVELLAQLMAVRQVEGCSARARMTAEVACADKRAKETMQKLYIARVVCSRRPLAGCQRRDPALIAAVIDLGGPQRTFAGSCGPWRPRCRT